MPSKITLAAITALVSVFLLAATGSASAAVVGGPLEPTASAWSAAEMRAALPLPQPEQSGLAGSFSGSASASASPPAGARPLNGERDRPRSAHGRIFFQKAGSDDYYSCSGTVVQSRKRNLVFTAGHCVFDLGTESFNERITFVPAYRDGQAPFGQFPAELGYTTSGWVGGSGTGHDIGAITVTEPVQNLVGGRQIDFDFSPRGSPRLSIFGYPALPSPPYNGEAPIVCDASYVAGIVTGKPPSLAAAPCDMQQGSSGGGWINSAGFLVSVVSHGYCDSDPKSCGTIFGPRLGDNAAKIYRQAGGSEPPQLSIVRGPAGRLKGRRAVFRFRFAASTPVTLECRLAGPPRYRQGRTEFRRCGRSRVYRNLKPGRYVLRVRLSDQVGRRAQLRRVFRVTRGGSG